MGEISMKILTQAPRGTKDILPSESYKWQYVESKLREEATLFGMKEIRVPIFEHTELFDRSVGDSTDVVQKEMYTFTDKGNRSVTLRPEITAGTVRSVLEQGLLGGTMPLKTFYIGPCFRYERPTAGRQRQFHQFGVEIFGAKGPLVDAELISSIRSVFNSVGIESLEIRINSIGCPTCRAKYLEALKQYFKEHVGEMCADCKQRYEKNPMRLLDCKVSTCKEIAKDAPSILDYLCEECSDHFEGLQKYLHALEIPFVIDPTIVRGLDYYTKTVFEFVSKNIGATGTVCGGGRYDGLVEQLGGKPTPALGFAIGMERLLMVMEATGCAFQQPKIADIYIGSIGENASLASAKMVYELRKEGFFAMSDLMNRSVKAQMKYANKEGCRFSMILGDSELENNKASIKNMETGETVEVPLGDQFIDEFYKISIKAAQIAAADAMQG